MKNIIKVFAFSLIIAIVLFSCSKENESTPPDYSNIETLPKDSGGIQKAVFYNSSINIYGYYVYIPSGYEQSKAIYPLLIFLHGSGEAGNSMKDSSVLKKVANNGPPKLIKYKKWSPRYPMIVVSPQCQDSWWDPNKVHKFIGSLIKNYRINPKRIYLTGLSMGGYGSYSYIETYADSGYAAAVVSICGAGNPSKASKYMKTPLWAFHGDADKTVPTINSINIVSAINILNPEIKAKLTIYPGVGHDSWSMTYDGSGMGKESKSYDAFNMSIYDWMFQYSK